MIKSACPNVLFAVWEVEPFLKVGGLGEVARSLPRALHALGVDVRLIVPNYKALKTFGQRKTRVAVIRVPYGKQTLMVTVHKIRFLNADMPVYLVGNRQYLDRPITETFTVFSAAVVEAIQQNIFGAWKPDVIHCNDNHCGAIPLLVKARRLPIKTILTIHCISHQRRYPVAVAEKLRIPKEMLSLVRWETKKKQFNTMLEGIVNADWVNTVSPTYLKEIQTEECGAGLDEVMKKYRFKTSAILNGIDYVLKNPATNQELAVRYSAKMRDSVADASVVEPTEGKILNKKALQIRLGLPVTASTPIIGYIGRLDEGQKGIELIHRMIVRKTLSDCQFVIMGQGNEGWEERFHTLQAFNPDHVAVITRYDDGLASLIYAGSDFLMIPSYFEPCCLIQMNAMRYGALPIARSTGGLTDTVIDGKNGFTFQESTSAALAASITTALKVKTTNSKRFSRMVTSAMQRDFSWKESAKKYLELYRKILN